MRIREKQHCHSVIIRSKTYSLLGLREPKIGYST